MATNVEVYIDGTDRSEYLKAGGGFSWSDELSKRSTCKCRLVVEGPTPYYRPLVGETFEAYINSTLVFGGSIHSIKEREPQKGNGVIYDLEPVNYNYILDRFVVFRKYEGLKAGDIVKDIIDRFIPDDEGITYTGVQDGFSLGKVVFGYRKASDCIKELADIVGFAWYVDENKDLQFFDRTTFSAPFSLADNSYNYRNLRITRTRTQYRNKQYIRAGFDTTDSQTEQFAGDGKRKSFEVVYPVAGSPEPAPVITLDTGGGPAAQTVGIRGIDDDTAFDWYYRAQDKTISQKPTGTAISSTDTLSVTYRGLFPIIVLRNNNAEIVARQAIEGGSGIYENVVDDNSIESSDFAEEKADGLLDLLGDGVPTNIEYETDDAGLRAGQLQGIDLPTRGTDLDEKTYLIESVKTVDIDGKLLRYKVKAVSGDHVGSWAEFYKKLFDAGRDYSLREGETLQVLNLAEEDIELTETYTQADALIDEDDDPYTRLKFGTTGATWGKAFWGAPPV